MPLSFPNVTVLGQTRESRFFGAGFQYASFRQLTVAGTLNDLPNDFGISGVWDGSQGLVQTITNNPNYQPLILNGVNFGSGRVNSMTFEPGIDVKTKGYQANITVYDSGNLFNFTGLYYSGIDTTNFPSLNSFNESYSFERKLNGGYAYTQNATIQFISGANNLFAIGAAQSLAKTLFTGGDLGFDFYSGYTNRQGKRYITEAYNLINNTCSFQQTFDFDKDDGPYSAIWNNTVSLDERGIMSAAEQGTVRGIENPNYQNALSAISTVMTGSYLRCSGAATNYFPTGAILVTSPVSQGRNIDIFTNNIQYTVTYDNSPLNLRLYFWDYALQVTKQDGVSTATENGTIVGRGTNPTYAFANAQSGFALTQPGISGRCNGLLVGNYAPIGFLASKEQSYAPVQGQVGYTYAYSNDPTLISDTGVRRMSVSTEDNDPVYIFNKLNIINVGEIAQNDYQDTPGVTTVSVQLEGDKTINLSGFLPVAVTQYNLLAPTGNDRYIGSSSYTYDPNANTFNGKLAWIYNKPAVITLQP